MFLDKDENIVELARILRDRNVLEAVEFAHSCLTDEENELYLSFYADDELYHVGFYDTTADVIHEILDFMGIEDAYLAHYGMPKRSGRYPWGSGENPYQHNQEFLRNYHQMLKSGMSQKEIAKQLGYVNADGSGNTSLLRMDVSTKTQTNREIMMDRINELMEQGKSKTAIAKELGVTEGTIRAALKKDMSPSQTTREGIKQQLRDAVEKNKYIDIGEGSELQLGEGGITADRRKKIINELVNEEGYTKHFVKVEQMGNPGKFTTIQVLAPPGTPYSEVHEHSGQIKNIVDYTEQNGDLGYGNLNMKRPTAIDRSRIMIHYGDQEIDGVTGSQRDGSIYVRPGVADLDLGGSKVVQGRVNLGDELYLKGQFAYGYPDEFPPGVDIIFNTNKPMGTPDKKVFKELKKIEVGEHAGEVDWDNPFGAQIKLHNGQTEYTDPKTGEKKLGIINKVNEEGDWSKWSNNTTLSKQMLSKQTPAVAKQQLDIALKKRQDEFDEIMSIQNPEVRKNLLEAFATSCDSAAENMKAAGFPRQSTNAIMPIASLKDNEIYAPNYKDGERVVLIRFPHESLAQIPELIVNNHCQEGIDRIGQNAIDVVGITKKTADKMSGADFDGDTVLVIPNNNGALKSRPTLKGLEGFDTDIYKYSESEKAALLASGKKLMKKGSSLEHIEMGKASNLITDMTLQGAPDDEVAAAIRYSMTVIDAGKHELNYKYAAIDNGIPELKKKWQNGGGSGTLISRSTGPRKDILEREDYKLTSKSVDPVTGEKLYKYKGNATIDPVTGKKTFESRYINPYDIDESGWEGRQYTTKTGKVKTATNKTASTQMAEVRDAHTLSTGTLMETVYANYANSCKELGNQARLAWLQGGKQKMNPSAKKEYATEVASLMTKLNDAKRNRPYEAQAQALAGELYRSKVSEYENLTGEQKKKYQAQCLAIARKRVAPDPYHPGKEKIAITPKEWEAIEAGAISANKLQELLRCTDTDVIKQYALPKERAIVSDSKKTLAKTLASNGYTNEEIAERLGVSTTTVGTIIKE